MGVVFPAEVPISYVQFPFYIETLNSFYQTGETTLLSRHTSL